MRRGLANVGVRAHLNSRGENALGQIFGQLVKPKNIRVKRLCRFSRLSTPTKMASAIRPKLLLLGLFCVIAPLYWVTRHKPSENS